MSVCWGGEDEEREVGSSTNGGRDWSPVWVGPEWRKDRNIRPEDNERRWKKNNNKAKLMEMRGIEPRASRMRSERSTI